MRSTGYSRVERAALNRYHRAVWETISPHLAGDERAWLKAATEAL